MYVKMNETLGRPVAHYELGDLLVSNYYKGDFILTGLNPYNDRFSFLCIENDDMIPVEVDLRACPKDMFKPFMEDAAFYE